MYTIKHYQEKTSNVLNPNLEAIDDYRLYHNFIRCFDSSYFIVERNNLKIIEASKKARDLLGIPLEIISHLSFFELIVEKVHPSDIYKVEEYIDLGIKPCNNSFSVIFKMKNKEGVWRNMYINIVQGELKNQLSPDYFYGRIIDLSEISRNDKILDEDVYDEDLMLMSSLSKRETEILNLVVQGYTDKEVALKLIISSHTAITHRKNIIRKLKVKNTASLAFVAGRVGAF